MKTYELLKGSDFIGCKLALTTGFGYIVIDIYNQGKESLPKQYNFGKDLVQAEKKYKQICVWRQRDQKAARVVKILNKSEKTKRELNFLIKQLKTKWILDPRIKYKNELSKTIDIESKDQVLAYYEALQDD